MTTIIYEDLPEWAQPNQQAAVHSYRGSTLVKVLRATKTQIVAQNRLGNEVRFERKPVEPDGPYTSSPWRGGERYRQRGEWSVYLVSPDEPTVCRDLFRSGVVDAVREVDRFAEERATEWSRGHIKSRDIPTDAIDQWAMERLDELENAIREARQKIEKTTKRYAERAALAKR
jgi:DNA-binding protein YbaB